jgi:hypothetical protein
MMSTTSAMLDSYPKSLGDIDRAALTACIDACVECAQVCTACADACLSEDSVADLTTCIRTDLDCAQHAAMQRHLRFSQFVVVREGDLDGSARWGMSPARPGARATQKRVPPAALSATLSLVLGSAFATCVYWPVVARNASLVHGSNGGGAAS